MASGSEVTTVIGSEVELPYGYARTYSGRISGVTEPGELSVHYPFPVKDLVFKVSSWGGGLVAGAGKLVGGQFR